MRLPVGDRQPSSNPSPIGWMWRLCVQWGVRYGAVGAIALSGMVAVPMARADEPAAFPPNPLDLTEPDPLLPELVVDRPLSPQERRVLTEALNQLQLQAEQTLSAGNIPGAIEIWNRELRLRRVLGVSEEVPALSRVGEIAWRESQTTEVRLITERLEQIEQEELAKTPPSFEQLLLIADAYQKMRAIQPAIAAYNRILLEAQQRGDRAIEQRALLALAEMHLAWFNYPESAAAYEQLLTLVQGNTALEVEYMGQLAYAYELGNQLEAAIAIQQRLVRVYQQQQDYLRIAPIKINIGDNYLALNRLDLAAPSYQEAFSVARGTQQYGFAGDALQRLATLYRSLSRWQDALVVYQLLIDVEQQSYNTLGIMNAYDNIGQVHRQLGNTTQAIAAFRRGLQFAQELNYKIGYFNTQIQELSQQ